MYLDVKCDVFVYKMCVRIQNVIGRCVMYISCTTTVPQAGAGKTALLQKGVRMKETRKRGNEKQAAGRNVGLIRRTAIFTGAISAMMILPACGGSGAEKVSAAVVPSSETVAPASAGAESKASASAGTESKSSASAGTESKATEELQEVPKSASVSPAGAKNDTTKDGNSFSGDLPSGSKKNAKKANEVSLDNQVIFDWEGIRVTAKSVDFSNHSPAVKLLIENNSEYDITTQARNVSVNDFAVTCGFSATVPSGKKANSSLDIYNTSLKESRIETMQEIEFTLRIFDSHHLGDTIVESDPIVITLTGTEDQVPEAPKGQVLIDQDGIRLVALGLGESDDFLTRIQMYAENNSDTPVHFGSLDAAVNGFVLDSTLNFTVQPGKKAYDNLWFFTTELEENEIEHIDEIQLDLTVTSPGTTNRVIPDVEDAVIQFE